MPSAWIEHVKKFQRENGCSYKQALKGASSTYQKGSGAMGFSKQDMGVPSSKQQGSGFGKYDPNNQQYHTTGGNLKKASKKQLIRLVEALGDKGIAKLSGMGAVGNMLKESAANNTVRLMDSGTNRATGEMETRGTGMRKMFPGFYGLDLLAATRGRGAVGNMLKESAANNTVRLMDSGTNRATGEMETRGTGVNRLKKAQRWEQFSNAALRDAIDTSGKAGRVYYETMNPMAQMGFGLKRHKKLSGKALNAAGY